MTKKPPKKVKCQAQYEAVLEARRACFVSHFSDSITAQKHQEAHQRLLEIEKVFSGVLGRREYRLFEMAFQLLGDGLCQLACANYRLAFYCLRAFLELSVAGVRYSAFEYELREWEAGRRDISWNVLSGDETGCFSTNFANAFLSEIKDEAKHYQSLAKRAYRECSEYVHGNPRSHGMTHAAEGERTAEWFELFTVASTAVLFCFFLRYLKDLITFPAFDSEFIAIVESELGHLPEVRRLLEKEVTSG